MDECVVSVAVPLPFQALSATGCRGRAAAGAGRARAGPFRRPPRRSASSVGSGRATPKGRRAGRRSSRKSSQVLDEAPLAPPPLLDLAAWVADHYLAPPGECYRLVLPPAGVRASRAVVRLLKPGGADDPLLTHLQSGALRVSALEKRLGRDPLRRGCRACGARASVAVEQALDAPGFREVQVAVLEAAGEPAPRGKAQAEVVARLRAAGGRARVADLVRDQAVAARRDPTGCRSSGALRLV